MIRLALLAALLSLSVNQAHSQSCPEADQRIGARVERRAALGARPIYDRMADSSQFIGYAIAHVPMMGIPAQVSLETTFSGQNFAPASAKTVLHVHTYQSQVDGTDTELTLANATLTDAGEALLLLDDTLRLRLQRFSYAPNLSRRNFAVRVHLEEDARFAVSLEDLIRIGAAQKGQLRVGEIELRIPRNFSRTARETARLYVCSIPWPSQ